MNIFLILTVFWVLLVMLFTLFIQLCNAFKWRKNDEHGFIESLLFSLKSWLPIAGSIGLTFLTTFKQT